MATCAVCGASFVERAIPAVAPEPAEPPDFDTRPGEPLRSTLGAWVTCCTECGYCADDITRADERAAAVVRSEAYQDVLADRQFPPKARQFLAFAVLLEKLHQFADAGWTALNAAWVCDDEQAEDAAAGCRAQAIEYWKRGKQVGQVFADDMATEFALVTDLYRRMGEFEHATVSCAEGLDLDDLPPAVESMLRRQIMLIQQRDSGRHSMKELLDSSPA